MEKVKRQSHKGQVSKACVTNSAAYASVTAASNLWQCNYILFVL